MDKKSLRADIRRRKREMTPAQIEEKSRILARLLVQTEAYQRAGTIYGYLPFNQEVRTVPMLEQALRDGKTVALPKCQGDTMTFYCVTDLSRAVPGYAGIPEPLGDEPRARDQTALVLMPGLAFDRAGRRVGYGGGFYDRFLRQEPNHPTIALCYDFQMVDRLETEEFDIPVDQVLWA